LRVFVLKRVTESVMDSVLAGFILKISHVI
jgi:hypothetical protein